MSTVDRRVVDMKFNYAEFAKGSAASISALDRLKHALKLDGASKGLEDISKASKNVNLGTISQQLDGLSGKFKAMSVVGITALASVAHQATQTGLALANSLTIGPVGGGLSEYEKKLSSIQTILSNTAAAGTKLEDVNAVLDELNKYSDQTIYNFGEMARNIGTFTAAGVELDTAVGSIKGIANLAALSGSSSEQASTAMYQLSQAISAGKVSLMDWNSVVNAGMGGSVFQRALAETAVAMGKLEKGALKLEGPMKNVKINGQSFREALSAENGATWLTSDVLTTALQNFTGDMKEADLVAQGFTKSQAQAIMKQAEMAKSAATVVKTGSQLMGTLKEAAESGWAETWELIIGDFEEAKTLWTGVNNVFGGIIQSSAEARNNVIRDWKKAGGRLAAIEAIKNIWEAFTRILTAVRQAFREIFPATSGRNLAELTKRFAKFTESLKVGSDNFQRIKSTAEGVFSVFKIITLVLKSAAKAFFSVFQGMQAGSGGVLQLGATFGEFLRTIHDVLVNTGALEKFFAILFSPLKLLAPLAALFSDIGGAIGALVSGDMSAFSAKMEEAFGSFFNFFSFIGKEMAGTLGRFGGFFDAIGTTLGGIGNGAFDGLASAFTRIGEVLTSLKESVNVGALFGSMSDGMSEAGAQASKLAVVGETLANIWRGFVDAISGIGGATASAGSGISELFQTIIDRFTNFVKNFDFQEAVALLNTAFFIALYMALRRFLKNMGDLVGKMGEVMDSITGVFGQLTDTLKTMQNNVRANMILKIAIAVGILTLSVLQLSKIDSGNLKKALLALGAIFAQLGIVLTILTKYNPASFTSAAAGLVLMAFAIKVLAGAIQRLGEMDPGVLIQGGIAIGVMMAALSGMLIAMNALKGIPAAAAGLLILSFALTTLSVAILLYAKIDWDTFAKGIITMTITLVALAHAMRAFPKGMIGQAAALVILSGALIGFATAIAILGRMDLWSIVKGVGAMGVALAMIVVAANAMVAALPGAAAMVVMATGLGILAGVIAFLGNLELKTIAIGLGAIFATFLVLGAAAFILGPVIPLIALLAGAMLALGKASLLLGAGFALFAGGLAALAITGAAGFAVLITGITSFLNLIPLFVHQLGQGLLAGAVVLREVGPKLVEAIAAIIKAMIEQGIKLLPKFAELFVKLIETGLKVIVRLVPKIVDAGYKLIIRFIEVIGNNVYRIVAVVTKLVMRFLDALGNKAPQIVDSAYKLIIKFMDGLSKAIDENSEEMGRAGGRLAKAIVKGVTKGLLGAVDEVGDAAKNLGKAALGKIGGFLGINSPSKKFMEVGQYMGEGLILGLKNYETAVGQEGEQVGKVALRGLQRTMSDIAGAVDTNMDMTPVIRPVIDLTAIQQGANGIGDILAGNRVSLEASYASARNASFGYQANKDTQNSQNRSDSEAEFAAGFTFIQNNNSPKALSNAEIYRQTRNGISVAKKGALTTTK